MYYLKTASRNNLYFISQLVGTGGKRGSVDLVSIGFLLIALTGADLALIISVTLCSIEQKKILILDQIETWKN